MKILYLNNFHDKKRRKGRDQQEMEILIGRVENICKDKSMMSV